VTIKNVNLPKKKEKSEKKKKGNTNFQASMSSSNQFRNMQEVNPTIAHSKIRKSK